VESQDITFELLAESEGFATLDSKLAAAVLKVAKGEIGRKLSRLAEVAAREGRPLKGHQCLFVVYEHYKMDEAAGTLFNLSNLITVKCEVYG
jgi:hypothetical protein